METTLNGHVEIDECGVARIAGSRIKVQHIALEKVRCGLSVEEIHSAHPHLTLSEIYAALSYYHDHKTEMDERIERDYQSVEAMRESAGETSITKKLRALGKL